VTALACQIIEAPGNVIRVGNTEGASQLQRKVAADVKFMNPSGTLNHIAANTPAIPWTSGTGFGSGVTPPTTAATIDVTTFAGRWVTFILAGANNSTQPMYVCQVTDWQAIAGPAGGRTVVPLDLWELHAWRYCGIEFVGEQALPNSGRYTSSGGVAVAASTDVTTHGDYGTQHITFPTAYATGLVPAVTVTPEDAAFVATVATITNTGFDVTVRRVRSLSEPVSGELDLTIPSGSNAIDSLVSLGVTYDAAPVIQTTVVADPSGTDGESSYQASLHDRSTTDFWAVIFHMPHPTPLTTNQATGPTSLMYGPANVNPASTTPLPTGGVNGSPSTGNNSDGTDTGGVIDPGSGVFTADQTTNHVHNTAGGTGTLTTIQQADGTIPSTSSQHKHGLSPGGSDHTHHHNNSSGNHTHPEGAHDHDTGDHVHRLNNHDHTVDVFPDEGSNRTLRFGWTAFGRQHADATNVPVSWVARG
jgi:hypothetical protein